MDYPAVYSDVGEIYFEQCFASMTAIALVFTKAGFVVATDGRSRLSEDENIGTDDQQKIFRGMIGPAEIAWTLAGSVLNKDKSFSLIDEVARAMQAANAVEPQPTGCYPWVEIFAAHLRASVVKARDSGLIAPFSPNLALPEGAGQDTFATVFMAGYFCNGRPSSVQIKLEHHNGELRDPLPQKLNPASYGREHDTYYGSLQVARRYHDCDEDKRFRRYFQPLGRSLEEGLAHVKGYIEACCGPLALEVDPVICQGIGGHIHAAAVTPAGFRWLIEPRSASSSL
jgi:hypothetical protein